MERNTRCQAACKRSPATIHLCKTPIRGNLRDRCFSISFGEHAKWPVDVVEGDEAKLMDIFEKAFLKELLPSEAEPSVRRIKSSIRDAKDSIISPCLSFWNALRICVKSRNLVKDRPARRSRNTRSTRSCFSIAAAAEALSCMRTSPTCFWFSKVVPPS